MDQTERFWAGVDKSGECWIWQRAVLNNGYGVFRVTEPTRKMMYAHRFSFELANGPIAPSNVVDHICHEPKCVRPDHMRAVTSKQNSEHQLIESRTGRSGVRGVVWNGTLGKWMAQVRHNRKLHIGGYFTTVDEAAAAVRDLRNQLYTHNDLDRQTI